MTECTSTVVARPRHVVRPLPESRNIDGRPVWEPPVFNYSAWIGEEYEKQREAVLKYYEGDVVKTTKFFDLDVENDLLTDYEDWVFEHHEDAQGESFWGGLKREILFETIQVQEELRTLNIVLVARLDGTYCVRAGYDAGYDTSADDSQSLRDNSLRDVGAADEEEHSSHPSRYTPVAERHAMENTNGTTRPLPGLGAQSEDDSSHLCEHAPRMELHPIEGGDERTPLLPTLGPSNERQDTDAKAWTAVLCGCPCS